jgi:hypothetical protein
MSRPRSHRPSGRPFPFESAEEGLRVATTAGWLPRSIGRALFHAYRGELKQPPVQSEGLVRVRWTRD